MRSRFGAMLLALGAAALLASVSMEVVAQAPKVDPAALQIVKRLTDTMNGLNQFSMHTENTLEDVLPSGLRVDMGVSADVTVSRPNKLRAVRRGDLVDQDFYYDGKTIALYNPNEKVYATQAAPATIDGMLDFVLGKLGLGVPAGDLIYSNAYPLMTQGLTAAAVIGKSLINGVKCDHILLAKAGIQVQIWVADSGPALPCKYIVTDLTTPQQLSITTVVSKWNTAAKATDASFAFTPPKGTMKIDFMQPAASR
jgi:hypothetical protein